MFEKCEGAVVDIGIDKLPLGCGLEGGKTEAAVFHTLERFQPWKVAGEMKKEEESFLATGTKERNRKD